jgi:fatty-acid desaturase
MKKLKFNFLASSTIGVQLFLLIAFLGGIFAFLHYGIDWVSFSIIILGYFLYACLGIIVMFHRNLTHQSYKTSPFIEKLFSFFGCLGNTGSSIVWVAIHLNHHIKSDKPGDPHSPDYTGLKMFTLDYVHDYDKNIKMHMRKILRDSYHRFLHRFYFLIIIAWSALLFALGGVYLMVFFHWIPAFLTAFFSNIVNYIGHKPNWWGSYRNYKLNDQSTNNWLWAIFTWGESWHNNHHRFPKNYMSGHKWWELDISGLIIKAIKHN